MSVWGDIHRRANGLQERKEDKIKPWDEFDLPIIRKVFSKVISSNIVPVQPMSEPTGKLFYTDFNFKP